MSNRPYIDQWELIEKSIDARMKPVLTAIFTDNEFTRSKLEDNTKMVKKVTDRHMWVRDMAIAILFLGVVVLFSMMSEVNAVIP